MLRPMSSCVCHEYDDVLIIKLYTKSYGFSRTCGSHPLLMPYHMSRCRVWKPRVLISSQGPVTRAEVSRGFPQYSQRAGTVI